MAIGSSNKTQRKPFKSGEESEYYNNDGVVVNRFHQQGVSVVLIVERLTPQLRKENYVKNLQKERSYKHEKELLRRRPYQVRLLKFLLVG